MERQLDLYLKYTKTGESEDLNALIESFLPSARYWANRYFVPNGGSDDLVQEALIGIWSGIKNFNIDRMDSVNFFSFISMCAHRKVLTAVKLSRRLHAKALNDAISLDAPLSGEDERTLSSILMDGCDNPEEVLNKKDNLVRLEKILTSRLSETEMTVLADFAEGYTYEEISSRIGKNKKTIDNALWRARKKLSNTLPC